jgi:hypothetical protein
MIPGIAVTYGGQEMGCWSITHTPTNMGLCKDFKLLDTAIRAVEKYCYGIDWYKLKGPSGESDILNLGIYDHFGASKSMNEAAYDEGEIIEDAMEGFLVDAEVTP